ncbi:MAG: tetratricopeptide repeat protein [Polyangiales bacterium]|nr:tetratricopeptide repeat protein [Myxococcales bacterium]
MTTETEARDHWAEAEPGIDLLETGDIDEAIRVLEAVILENDENEYAYFFLGNAHFEQEAWDKALKAYLFAVERAPEYVGAMIGAGHALRMMGRERDAIRMAEQVLKRQANDPDALYLLGVTHFHLGNEAPAKRFLESYLATRPEAEVDLEVRGMLEVLAGRVLPLESDDDTVN